VKVQVHPASNGVPEADVIAVPVGPGGIPSQPACVGQLGGTMTAAIGPTSTLTGSYTVTSATCTPPFGTTGNLSLTR